MVAYLRSTGALEAEERDRMMVVDPVVLRSHQARDRGRWHPAQHGRPVHTEQLEVVEQHVVVPQLLLDVLLEIPGQAGGHRIVGSHCLGPRSCHLGQGDRCTNDFVLGDQEPRPEVGKPRVRH